MKHLKQRGEVIDERLSFFMSDALQDFLRRVGEEAAKRSSEWLGRTLSDEDWEGFDRTLSRVVEPAIDRFIASLSGRDKDLARKHRKDVAIAATQSIGASLDL